MAKRRIYAGRATCRSEFLPLLRNTDDFANKSNEIAKRFPQNHRCHPADIHDKLARVRSGAKDTRGRPRKQTQQTKDNK